jgi:hypothetical protein
MELVLIVETTTIVPILNTPDVLLVNASAPVTKTAQIVFHNVVKINVLSA